MARLYLLLGSNRLEWDVKELEDRVLITPTILYDASGPKGEQGKSESDVTLGANTLAIPKYQWWYGFTDAIETWGEEDERIAEACLDCIELFGFEKSAQSFAVFYPAGVDAVEGPSVDFVYRDSLATRNTPEDLVNLPPEKVALHIQAAEGLSANQRGVLRVKGPEKELTKLFEEHRWYILGLDSKTGIPSIFYPLPGAFNDEGGAEIGVRWVLEPDLLTRRRLERVISLDFVRDLDLEPPEDPHTEVPPVLVLLPSDEDLKGEHWQGWEELIADLGPLVWDEDRVKIKLPDLPVEQSKVSMSNEQAVDDVKSDETIVLNPVTPKKKEGLQTTDKLKGKVKDQKRKPLAQLDQNVGYSRPKLQSSPIAAKRRERIRTSPKKFTIYEDK